MKRAILTAVSIFLVFSAAEAAEKKKASPARSSVEPETMQVLRKGSRYIYKYTMDGSKSAKVRLIIKMSGKECKSDDIMLKATIGERSPDGKKNSEWNVAHTFPEGCRAEVSAIVTSDPEGMVFVKGGCFRMGDLFGDGDEDELPPHEVCLDDYFIDTYEVTQSEYEEVMGENPTYFEPCAKCPVDSVNWFKAVEFCENLGKRLPTEAEWEYAARSRDRDEKWAGTNDLKKLKGYSRYMANTHDKPQPVGTRKPNRLGLYDMSGNVWEWINDWYAMDYYAKSQRDNPSGPAAGDYRIVRGGAWNYQKMLVRTTHRNRLRPEKTDSGRGFRCALSP